MPAVIVIALAISAGAAGAAEAALHVPSGPTNQRPRRRFAAPDALRYLARRVTLCGQKNTRLGVLREGSDRPVNASLALQRKEMRLRGLIGSIGRREEVRPSAGDLDTAKLRDDEVKDDTMEPCLGIERVPLMVRFRRESDERLLDDILGGRHIAHAGDRESQESGCESFVRFRNRETASG